ncbi:hypothetical protein [Mycoplasma sp. E35C]|uniref:hypothetical protein n=1 Tax=Mycoplasma sp. E35C TaxID=2801918 RepID=UPI001CA3BF24|nr:hypothetical protein [Mycoplasma sp. E35C]QZX49150.1 hypothetical protein JJE79_03810 [Mycoplasma sp. E35C]
MDNNKPKKKERRRFIDLSADLDEEVAELDPEFEENTEVKIEKNKDNEIIDFNDPIFFSEKYEKIKRKTAEQKRQNSEEEIQKNTVKEEKVEEEIKELYVDSSLEIKGQEPLTKGMHFYTNSRVIRKVRECAKNKGLSISRLITMILDKSIKEE